MEKKISQEIINIFKSKFKYKFLHLHEPDLDKSSIKYLKNCIKTNSVSAVGNFVKKFEGKISDLTGAKYVITTNSCTPHILFVSRCW